MTRTALLFAISIALLAASGCVASRAPLSVRHEFTRCPRPTEPELPQVDESGRFGSPENRDRIMTIIDLQREFIERQAAALDCYEAQVSGGK